MWIFLFFRTEGKCLEAKGQMLNPEVVWPRTHFSYKRAAKSTKRNTPTRMSFSRSSRRNAPKGGRSVSQNLWIIYVYILTLLLTHTPKRLIGRARIIIIKKNSCQSSHCALCCGVPWRRRIIILRFWWPTKNKIKIRNFSFLPDPNRASREPSTINRVVMVKKIGKFSLTESVLGKFPLRFYYRYDGVYRLYFIYFFSSRFPFQIKKSNTTREYHQSSLCVWLASTAGIH